MFTDEAPDSISFETGKISVLKVIAITHIDGHTQYSQ